MNVKTIIHIQIQSHRTRINLDEVIPKRLDGVQITKSTRIEID